MDPRIRRFRERVRELNRGRQPRGRRYGAELRREALAIVADHRGRGESLESVARALGLAATVLSRWQKSTGQPRLRRVIALEAPAAPETDKIILVTRAGHRLEGLGVAEAIQVLRALL